MRSLPATIVDRFNLRVIIACARAHTFRIRRPLFSMRQDAITDRLSTDDKRSLMCYRENAASPLSFIKKKFSHRRTIVFTSRHFHSVNGQEHLCVLWRSFSNFRKHLITTLVWRKITEISHSHPINNIRSANGDAYDA